MYEELKGKTLLFLGASKILCEPVKTAKSMGIRTIAVDYYENSPAKRLADKSFLISTTDIESIVELCRKEKVDGVFTAYMDFLLPYAGKICDDLGFPFYASEEQLRLSVDKSFFKEKCRKCGVPVPKDHYPDIEKKGADACEISFPVVVKPVDNSSGRGVTVCHNRTELEKAMDYARENSLSRRIIVEEFLSGTEICATYTMKDGQISLSCVKDKILSQDHTNITSQSDCMMLPSMYLDRYEKEVNPSVVRLLQSVKAKDGVCFVQGKASENGITIFEMGYRMGSAADYREIAAMNVINYLKMMIAYSLSGNMGGYELSQDDPHFPEYVCTVSLYGHGGTIGSMQGLEKVSTYPGIIHAEWMRSVGDRLKEENSLMQKVFYCSVRAKSIEDIKKTIRRIQEDIKVLDTEGNNMLYRPFDVNRLDVYRELQDQW